jgi:peptidyl-tRNA hydrolase
MVEVAIATVAAVATALPIEMKETDEEIIDSLLNRSSLEQLDKLILEINEEKDLRKIKDKRMLKLKEDLRKEKNKMLREVKDIKVRMLKNLQEESTIEEDFDDDDEEVIKLKKYAGRPKKSKK